MVAAGIDAIGFYTTNYFLDLKTLAAAREVDVNKFYTGLGQQKMAVIPPDEDVVTMAAEAGAEALKSVDPNDITFLMFATESSIDQSKAAGIFVHKLLNLPAHCRVIELKQACYSATAGIQLALPLLRENPKAKILLIASDIARYGLGSKGESSQGGGAVAMVLSCEPRILAVEPGSGFVTEDVMDFWRPNYCEEAFVDGKYSCELYLKLVQKTWEQYTSLSKRTFSDHARFCFHVPVPKLVEKAHQHLAKINGLSRLTQDQMAEQVGDALHYGRLVGNCYSAALYLSFLSLLENSTADMSDKRVGFYSYGSGCVAEFFSGVVQPGYEKFLHKQAHLQLLEERRSLTQEEYEAFYRFHFPRDGSTLELPRHTEGQYRLRAIEQHERIYEAVV